MEIQAIESLYPDIAMQLKLADDMRLRAILQQRRDGMRVLRAKLGYSAKTFGEACGVTQQYIFSLESGKAKWSPKLIARCDEHLKSKLPAQLIANQPDGREADHEGA